MASAAAGAAASCAKVSAGSGASGGGGGPGAGGAGGDAGARGSGGRAPVRDAGPSPIDAAPEVPPIIDFPADPIFGTPDVPPGAPGIFDGASDGGASRPGSAPCIASPQAGTLMPRNWLRPRFEVKPASGENLFEIRLRVARFPTPLRIYTTQTAYVLPRDVWNDLRNSVVDEPITVAVRAATVTAAGDVQAAPSAAAQSSFTIAPVEAPGKIVYWALSGDGSNGMGMLKGFGIGEEGVRDVLTPDQVQNRNATNDGCIGCHAATPGGDGVGFVFGPPQSLIGLDTYFDNVADIRAGMEGALPSYMAPTSLAALQALRGIPAYSPAHWGDGDRIVLLTDAQNQGDLRWLQLDSGAQGLIARGGDTQGAVEPAFSHDGTRIAYVSTPMASIHDGRLGNGPGDLFMVPYGARAGGSSAAVAGASDVAFTEYYPSFSPRDDYLAFTRFAGNGDSYANAGAEIFVVGVTGGGAIRLPANDPPDCLYQHSPGLTNDWAKWSPDATTAGNGKTYNWLTFSSRRAGRAQIYITAVVTPAGGGTPDVYPALYLWNQPADESNHTPSWDSYAIPPVVIVP
jgi:hypothetical protein